MNEEEIIEIIEKELTYFRCCEDDIKFKKAIHGLLDLYQNEKEKDTQWKKIYNEDQDHIIELNNKIFDLEEKNKELKELMAHNLKYTNELEKDLFENSSNYVISKDKIKAKIEKYRCFVWHNKDDEYWANRILDGLQELLEEE